MTTTEPGRTWAHVREDGGVVLAHRGQPAVEYAGQDLAQARELLVAHLAEYAKRDGQAILAHVTEPEGQFHITVDEAGAVTSPTEEIVDTQPPTPNATTDSQARAADSAHEKPAPPPADEPAAEAPVTRRQLRQSFLTTTQAEQPATTGVRGALTRIGIRTGPSATERARRDDEQAVSQHWPGVRTIAVVNGKGGASKTPTTALLSAVFARNSGAPTVAWDNNETRGTLGWRTEQGPHEGTVLDLLPHSDTLLAPQARAGDVGHYVHHQGADKYDVLRSNPHLLSAEQRLTGDDVDTIHDVMARYYRLIFVDSGNDESAGHWMRMIDKADAIVVATIAKPEHAEAGALLLEALAQRDDHSAQLAREATVIISQAREKDANPSAAQIATGFSEWVRRVVTIPYDRAMVENVLHYDALAPTTRRAWLHAAAAIAEGL